MSDDIKVYVVNYTDRKNLGLRYTDPATNKSVRISAGTARRSEAEKLAGALEAELREGRRAGGHRMTWSAFLDAWREVNTPRIAAATVANYETTIRAFERHCRPKKLADLTTERIEAFARGLRSDGLSEASVKRHLGALRALARWGHKRDLLVKLPTFDMPRRGATAKMKGRPITGEEFDRMLDAIPRVVIERFDPKAAKDAYDGDPLVHSWRTLLRGLWWSGLRLGEAIELRWDQTPGGIWVILDGRKSVLAFDAESQKSGRVELVPLAPEAVELLESMKQGEGYVFAPLKMRGGEPMQRTAHKQSQIIAKIGEAAGIVVGERKNRKRGKAGKVRKKYASAHDLRRAFGFRWARRVMPPELMHLMRHKDVKTTLTFYVGRNAEATAGALWDALGSTLGSTTPNSDAGERQSDAETPSEQGFPERPRQDSNLRHTV